MDAFKASSTSLNTATPSAHGRVSGLDRADRRGVYREGRLVRIIWFRQARGCQQTALGHPACPLSLALEILPRRSTTDRSGGTATAEEDGVFTGETIAVAVSYISGGARKGYGEEA